MNDRPDPEWEQVLGNAMRLVTAGVDPDVGAETVADALAALRKQARALKETEYSGNKTKKVCCPECETIFEVDLPAPELLAKTMAHTAKMIDETARLVQFIGGKPDARLEVAGMEWLQALDPEQVEIVRGWVAEKTRLLG